MEKNQCLLGLALEILNYHFLLAGSTSFLAKLEHKRCHWSSMFPLDSPLKIIIGGGSTYNPCS